MLLCIIIPEMQDGSSCRYLRYHLRRETICSGNILLHDSTHACKYDVIAASACLRCERCRLVIEAHGLSVRVSVFS